MAPFVVLLLGPEDRVCGIDDMRSALDTGRLTILPSLTVISCLKAIEAVQALNKAITTYGNVEAVFMHHNFCARGKEEFSDAIKTVLSQKYPHIPIICWGKVVKGGQQGRDFHYGLEWEAKSGSTPVVKVLGMLKSGQISTGKVGNGVASPRGSIDLQPQSSPRGSIEMASYQGGGSNVRRSIDMNGMRRSSMESSRSVTFGSPRPSMDVAPGGNMRPSMDLNSYGSNGLYSPVSSTSQLQYVLPQAPPIESPSSNSQLIMALADEVQRLKVMVEEKRSREKGSSGGGASSSAGGASRPAAKNVTVGVVGGLNFV